MNPNKFFKELGAKRSYSGNGREALVYYKFSDGSSVRGFSEGFRSSRFLFQVRRAGPQAESAIQALAAELKVPMRDGALTVEESVFGF